MNVVQQLEDSKKKIHAMYESLSDEHKNECKEQIENTIKQINNTINEIKKALENAN